MMAERTSIYPTDEDKALLDRIEAEYGLKASTAYRTGLRLLAEALDGNRITNHLKGERKMQGFYITGTKGSYIELEDGRWADSVSDRDGTEEYTVEELLEELTNASEYPQFCDLSMEELRAYVGAE